MWRNHSATFRFAVYGAAWGLLFPVFSTLGDLLHQRLPMTLGGLWQVQSSSPLHWVIDTIPILLAIWASLAGRRQEESRRLKQCLEEQVKGVSRYGTGNCRLCKAEDGNSSEETGITLGNLSTLGVCGF